MSVINSIQSIFNKINIEVTTDNWTVTEIDSGASFNNLHIENFGMNFNIINNNIYQSMPNITTDISSKLRDLDCDGVAFTEINDQKYIILSELKSKYDTNKLSKAYKQIIFTFLKLHMLFSICKEYNINDYKIIGIIACKPVTEEQKTSIEHNLLWSENQFLNNLYYHNKSECTVENIDFLRTCNLHKNIATKRFTIFLQTASDIDDNEANIDLSNIIH